MSAPDRIDVLDISIKLDYLDDKFAGITTSVALNPNLYSNLTSVTSHFERIAYVYLEKNELRSDAERIIFEGTKTLSEYTPDQIFELTSLQLVDDFGAEHIYNSSALNELGFEVTKSLVNPLGDDANPTISNVSLGDFQKTESEYEVEFSFNASDEGASSLDRVFFARLTSEHGSIHDLYGDLSPTSPDLVLGNAGVGTGTFILPGYSRSGEYELTLVVVDGAGNATGYDHIDKIKLVNPNEDALAPSVEIIKHRYGIVEETDRGFVEITFKTQEPSLPNQSGLGAAYAIFDSSSTVDFNGWVDVEPSFYGSTDIETFTFRRYFVREELDQFVDALTSLGVQDLAKNESFEVDYDIGSRISFEGISSNIQDPVEHHITNVVFGSASAEDIIGLDTEDWLLGGAGNDVLLGYLSDDTLNGGTGNDTLDGGEGFDTAVFNLASSEVQFEKTSEGYKATSAEGEDILIDIEQVQFTDKTLLVSEASNSKKIFDLVSLNGTNGFSIHGVEAGDQSGWSVSSAGDVNGDGIDDVIIGARYADPGSIYRAGESYVVFGSENWTLETLELSSLDGLNGFRIVGIDPDDQSGGSVFSAGDVNGDGIDDIIIGASHSDPDGKNRAGESYVVFGSENWSQTEFDLSTLNGRNGFTINGINEYDYSGFSVSSAGDVNGDGVEDLIVGTQPDPEGQSIAGESYVVFGSDTRTASELELSTLDGTNGFKIKGIDQTDQSGNIVSSAGDVNGDGVDDIIIGAWSDSPTDKSISGDSYVVFGSNGWSLSELDLTSIDGRIGFKIKSIVDANYYGGSVASAGDINDDGIDDLIIGARFVDGDSKPNGSESYVIFGSESWSFAEIDLSTLDGQNGFRINGIKSDDYAGWSVSSVGDVNGDGIDDILIGAPRAGEDDQSTAGESYVVFGAADWSLAELDLSTLNGDNGFQIIGIGSGDTSGWSVASGGDFNGDGIDDILIGAPHASPNSQLNAGESYVVFGESADVSPAPPTGVVLTASKTFDQRAISFPSIGDVELEHVGFGSNYTYNGNFYEDTGAVIWREDGVLYLMGGAGSFDWDESTDIVSGTVSGFGLVELDYIPATFAEAAQQVEDAQNLHWVIENAQINAGDLYETYKTIDKSDELSVVNATFAGNDIFNLSSFDDYALGFSGDDTVNGGTGNDTLDGGEGFDTAVFNLASSEVQFEKTSEGYRASSAEGEDILIDIEQLQFTDKTLLVSELSIGSTAYQAPKYADVIAHDYSYVAHNYGAITRLDNGSIVSTWNAPFEPWITPAGEDASNSWDIFLRIKKFGERNYEDVLVEFPIFSPNEDPVYTDPGVTPFSNDTFLVFWTASNTHGNNSAVHVAEYNDSGEFVREILNLRDDQNNWSGDEVGRVEVQANNDGILLVSYMIRRSGSDEVEYLVLDASSEVPVVLLDQSRLEQNTGYLTDPVIAVYGDGFLLITAEKLYSINPEDNYTANEILSFDLPAICNVLVPLGNDQFIAGFGGHDDNIYLKKLDLTSDGSITKELTIDVTARGEFDLDVIDGQLLLTWAQHVGDENTDNGLRAQFFDFELNALSAQFSIYDEPNSNLDQELEVDAVVTDLGLSLKFNTEFRSFDIKDEYASLEMYEKAQESGWASNNVLDVIDLANRGDTVIDTNDDLYIVDDQNFWDLWASGDVVDVEAGTDHLYLAPEAPIESLPDAAITNMGVGLEYLEFDLNVGTINAVPKMPGTMAVTEGTYPVEGSDINAPTFLDFENFSYYGDADAKIADTSDDNVLITGGGEDIITSIGGRDLILSHEQSDEIILSSSKTYASNIVAHNISADWQIGTNARVSVSGKTQFETVVNGGEGYDVVTLTDKSDAYFLHDNHSAFNTDIILSEDFRGRDGFNRISLIEEIASGDGNDVIDLTSPDYSLAGQTLLVDAGNGKDVVWGSDADETLIGGADDDVLFGGAGINELFGGSGADEFQFTRTSENDTVSDFSIADGDTLKFFNKGGALFDRDSLSLNAAGDELSIAYGDEIGEILTITLYEAGLNLDDLTEDVLFIV